MPRRLLGNLPGVTLVPIREADVCCGSAGIYNLLQPELAGAVLRRKVDVIRDELATHPDAGLLVTANPGCLFQIRAGLERAGTSLSVVHPVELMAQRLLAE
jgi:glycolate oxidase iron-sulfur subunit